MHKLKFCFLGLVISIIAFPSQSQVISASQPMPSTDIKNANDEKPNIDFSSSRNEDIFVFENNMKMFQNAVDVKNVPEAEVFLSKNIEITRREIARAEINLTELKAGNINHLDDWRKENGVSEPLNISMEINHLNDNINSMEYRYKNLKNANLNNLTDPRANSTWLADMRIILKNMNKNLKYESDKKIIHIENPPLQDTLNADGKAIITQSPRRQSNENSNPMMNDFYEAQAARTIQFVEEKNDYQNQLQLNDYKSAQRTYRLILQIMQSEIDANVWLKTQKDEASRKLATINLDEVSPIIAEQKNLLEEAAKIKIPSAPDDEFNPSESIVIIAKFQKTMK